MLGLLVNVLLMFLVFGLIYWIITLIPLPPPFKVIVNVVIGIIAIVVLIGLVGWIPGLQIGHMVR